MDCGSVDVLMSGVCPTGQHLMEARIRTLNNMHMMVHLLCRRPEPTAPRTANERALGQVHASSRALHCCPGSLITAVLHLLQLGRVPDQVSVSCLHGAQAMTRQKHPVSEVVELPGASTDILQEACKSIMKDWAAKGMLSPGDHARYVCCVTWRFRRPRAETPSCS